MKRMQAKETIIQAMRHHENGALDEAEKLYRKAIADEIYDKRVYVNLAAILRKQGKPEEAARIANDGLQKADNNSPILLNTLANSLRDMNRIEEAINMYRRAIKEAPDYYDPKISLVVCLSEGGYKKLADITLKCMIKHYGIDDKALVNQLIIREVERAAKEGRSINDNLKILLEKIDEESGEEKRLPQHWFSLAQICLANKQIEASIEYYNSGISIIKKKHKETDLEKIKEKLELLYTCSSWNFGCGLVRQGNFELGWKLYDHGLRTPCEGKQRWQRSLYKPFSLNKIKLWKGENLRGKKILLLGEQGIGDSMMFITAITRLKNEGGIISIVVPERLKAIYKRSLPDIQIMGDKECREAEPEARDYDFQCPLGSIIQHRYKKLEDFKGREFSLIADKDEVDKLRRKYLGDKYGQKYPIIGISWQGGGTKERISDKSINLKELLLALKQFPMKLVSLQYGNDAEVVTSHAKEHNIDFVDDEDIQATKDMESWLNQVDACDAVISIANTTIHGAGGLNKPTICLLGNKADWRWLTNKEEKYSYWYPTVRIAWQDEGSSSWEKALGEVQDWIRGLDIV